jgi:hypothetical protein
LSGGRERQDRESMAAGEGWIESESTQAPAALGRWSLARLTRPALALGLQTARRDHAGHDNQKEADDAPTTVLDLHSHLVGDLAASETTHATSSRIK